MAEKEKFQYRHCKVTIEVKDQLPVVTIDGEEQRVEVDADTGVYHSPAAPYQEFGTVEELAKGIIDCHLQEEEVQEDES